MGNFLRNFFAILIIICNAFLTVHFSLIDLKTGAIIFAIFTMFFILFFYGNKFEVVELLGAKFKLKELNNSINELKTLSKVVASISLELLQQSNRYYSGESEKVKIDFFNQINEVLDNVNVSQKEKDEIFDPYWHKWIISDYHYELFPHIHNTINRATSLKEEKKEELINLCKKGYPDLIQAYKISKEKGVEYESDIEAAMEDFIYYVENKQHKDQDRWLKFKSKE